MNQNGTKKWPETERALYQNKINSQFVPFLQCICTFRDDKSFSKQLKNGFDQCKTYGRTVKSVSIPDKLLPYMLSHVLLMFCFCFSYIRIYNRKKINVAKCSTNLYEIFLYL